MRAPDGPLCYKSERPMIPFFIGFLTCLSAFFRSRYNLGLEILALRHQLGILKRKQSSPSAPTPESNVLDPAPPPLACMEQHPDHRQIGNRCRVSSMTAPSNQTTGAQNAAMTTKSVCVTGSSLISVPSNSHRAPHTLLRHAR